MTGYYFFEDRDREYAMLHDARCGHCRRGLERRARALTPSCSTYWHGPYETLSQATAKAERMGLPASACANCLQPV